MCENSCDDGQFGCVSKYYQFGCVKLLLRCLVVSKYCQIGQFGCDDGHVVEMFKLSCDTIMLQISFLVFCDDEFIIHFVMMRLDVNKAIKDAKKP